MCLAQRGGWWRDQPPTNPLLRDRGWRCGFFPAAELGEPTCWTNKCIYYPTQGRILPSRARWGRGGQLEVFTLSQFIPPGPTIRLGEWVSGVPSLKYLGHSRRWALLHWRATTAATPDILANSAQELPDASSSTVDATHHSGYFFMLLLGTDKEWCEHIKLCHNLTKQLKN